LQKIENVNKLFYQNLHVASSSGENKKLAEYVSLLSI